ncbi:hypothetical protein PROSTU_02522 [Providencia stuartii ATCC 25827]|uniref:Uncharacterized protein n=1 Tax=Providencia stuartii ATCC 25827 TaxID=471874 RepID=A0AA86YWQ4_PROST|nr:hypothetical protein PROSTU_02522 [Providencia stuartii ATCC 25827]
MRVSFHLHSFIGCRCAAFLLSVESHQVNTINTQNDKQVKA